MQNSAFRIILHVAQSAIFYVMVSQHNNMENHNNSFMYFCIVTMLDYILSGSLTQKI